MKVLFYTFSVIFTCVICILALVVALFNAYLFIRRRFRVKVNCWFCNNWTKVEYDNQNSFECPTCLQYNGFAKDGGYNRTIPEQHDEHLNKRSVVFHKKVVQSNSSSNGLCATCNHNQGLKVFQLANFVPLEENNYDVEVEHFQKQLEKAYRLCRRCEEVLEKTLQTQNLRIIGNRVRQLKRQAVTLLDLNKPYRGGAKKPLFIKFLHFSVFLFASFILVDAIATFDYSDGHLKTLLPHFLLNTARKLKFIFNGMLKTTEDLQIEMNPLVLTVSEQCTKFSEEIGKLSSNFWDSISEHHLIQHCLQNLAKKIPNFSKVENNEHHLINCAFTAISGLLLQMILCFWSKSAPLIKTSQILSWFLLTLLSFNVLLKKYELFQLFLKIFCPLLIIYTMSIKVSTTTQETSQKQKKLKKRRNIRNLVKDDRSFSDLSDIENFTENERSSFNKFAQTECDTFNTAKRKDSFSMESDLNASLSNLALGTVFPKPLLSPSKLNNVTRNPWTAGGFWNVPYSCSSPEPTLCNLSRSSSHSSGFGSHTTNDNQNFNSLPASPGNSISGGDDHISIFSEPAYHFNSGQFELYKTRNGSVAASICTPNSGYVGMENVFRQPMDGMLWSRRGNAFSYTSSVINADWPGSLFKNICGNQTKTNSSFTRIRD